ncbi:uncharacterized protein METZ01_LOCUS446168, partial [marine metagenome]
VKPLPHRLAAKKQQYRIDAGHSQRQTRLPEWRPLDAAHPKHQIGAD